MVLILVLYKSGPFPSQNENILCIRLFVTAVFFPKMVHYQFFHLPLTFIYEIFGKIATNGKEIFQWCFGWLQCHRLLKLRGYNRHLRKGTRSYVSSFTSTVMTTKVVWWFKLIERGYQLTNSLLTNTPTLVQHVDIVCVCDGCRLLIRVVRILVYTDNLGI